MKLLVYGAKGWIGGLFCKYLDNEGIPYSVGLKRIDSIHISDELLKLSPTNVISFTGRTHGSIDGKLINTIDYLEYPGKLHENMKDNLFGPINLAEACKKLSIHYSYIGTGCIFNGTPDEPFSEESLPNYFGSSYSVVKGYTDTLMRKYSDNVLNLRIRMPISSEWNSRNFITKITKYSKICSIPNSMTVLDDFFPIFVDLMKNGTTGTLNCTNPGLVSHNEILSSYRNILQPDFEWTNFTLEEQSKVLKSDRSNNLLDTALLQKLYPEIKPIKQSVVNVLLKMKNNIN